MLESTMEEANQDTSDQTNHSENTIPVQHIFSQFVSRNKEEFPEVEPNAIDAYEDAAQVESFNGRSADYWPLYKMIQSNDWKGVEEFVKDHPDALTAKIAPYSRTLFHLIFWLVREDVEGATSLIEKLAPKVKPTSSLAQKDSFGRTVLVSCAVIGNTKASKIFVEYYAELPNIPADSGFLPVHFAATSGHKDMVQYLVSVTAQEKLNHDAGSMLLSYSIKSNLYDAALDLLKQYPAVGRDSISSRESVLRALAGKPLAFASGCRLGRLQRIIYNRIPVLKKENISSNIDQTSENQRITGDLENLVLRPKATPFGSIQQLNATFGAVWDKLHMMVWNTLLRVAPSIKVMYEHKLTHMQMIEIVKTVCEGVIWTDPEVDTTLSPSFLFTAARLGISEIVNEILMAYSISVRWVDTDLNNVFMLAVLNRREEVFNLIYSMGLYKGWISSTDTHGNNMLHLAGMLVPSSEIAGAALQMQRELQWFKAVENVVPPDIRENENSYNLTPREVFTSQHRELAKEGEKWMKDTASSCTVAVTLIITVVFAAAFTVPGGNNNEGIPNFLRDSSFIVFAISDALALFSSTTSLLMFLGILTSRYSEEDFLVSLPRKLIIGLITLFISIASMMVAFGATIYLVLSQPWKWVIIPIALLGCVPVTLFVFLQFPLLLDMFLSTYGRSIFGPKKKYWM